MHDPERFKGMVPAGWRVGEVFLHRWWRNLEGRPSECVVTGVEATMVRFVPSWLVYFVESPRGRWATALPESVPSLARLP